MLTDEKLHEIRVRQQDAFKALSEAIDGSRPLASIPAQEDEDADLIVGGSLNDIPALMDELETLRTHLRAAGITRPEGLSELVRASRSMMREWVEVVGSEQENSTPANTLEKLRSALRACIGEEG